MSIERRKQYKRLCMPIIIHMNTLQKGSPPIPSTASRPRGAADMRGAIVLIVFQIAPFTAGAQHGRVNDHGETRLWLCEHARQPSYCLFVMYCLQSGAWTKEKINRYAVARSKALLGNVWHRLCSWLLWSQLHNRMQDLERRNVWQRLLEFDSTPECRKSGELFDISAIHYNLSNWKGLSNFALPKIRIRYGRFLFLIQGMHNRHVIELMTHTIPCTKYAAICNLRTSMQNPSCTRSSLRWHKTNLIVVCPILCASSQTPNHTHG